MSFFLRHVREMGAALSSTSKSWRRDDNEEVNLDALPNELLLCIFEYLSEEELLRVRVVCRRWRDVALSDALWRSRELVLGMGRHFSPCWRLILARAPCVGKVWFSARWALNRFDIDDLQCAILKLDLRDIEELGSEDMKRLSAMVSRQAILDGLRGLRLHVSPQDTTQDFTEMFKAIGKCAVERLMVRLWDNGLLRCSPEALVPRCPGTLKKLSYVAAGVWPDPWLQSLLQHHATSLEKVRLFNPSLRFPCSLLAECSNLRLLDCPLLPGMDSLLHCRQLKELRLEIGRNPGNKLSFCSRSTEDGSLSFSTLLQGAVLFSRAATHLQILRIGVLTDADPDAAMWSVRALRDIVAAIASSGQALLGTLSISSPRDPQGGTAWLGDVLDLLPGLPHLEYLELFTSDLPPASVLRALTPASAPALRAMRLPWDLGPHRQHMAEIRSMLARCPAAHVTGLMLLGRDRGGDWEGLAQELGLPIDCRFNLYAHPASQKCHLHATTLASDPWFRI
ncbi:S-phase kinase-associated protein 2 [Frankliniella fusca]|uniref:S-phase kinase-associated protein 2 n=1 Tax=Frankliniella fusca TaxID=407009 RepID=A0AAE1I3F1_9NEOP|nr:S-phase kinase-associated protein 2 [Frankliniella fusca]